MKKDRQAELEKEQERAEAEDTLKSMVSSLNELPTEVLTQLCDNLDKIEAYNKKHHLTSGSSTGAYAIAGLEELLELNEGFLSICLLGELVKTRLVDESKPLEAIMLLESKEDLEVWSNDLSWVEGVVNPKNKSIERIGEGYFLVSFLSDWGLVGKLSLLSLESIQKGLPKELRERFQDGCRVCMHKGDYDESFFLKLADIG